MSTLTTVNASRIGAVAWACFGIAALLALRVPFTGDQYFFALGAEAIARGDALYTDFWDVKQPGIFYLYRFAALFPGDITLAVRILEILVWAATCVLVRRMLIASAVDRAIAALTPAILGAAYLLAAPAWHLSQVESFVVLPLTFVLSIALHTVPTRRDWALLGVATACVVWFKFVLVLVPAALAVMLVWRAWRHKVTVSDARRLATDVLVAALAFVAALAVLLMPFWSRDGLSALFEVTWSYPSQAMATVPRAPVERLEVSFMWFGALMAPLALLALATWRLRPLPASAWMLLGVLIATLVTIGLQRFSWWAYHTTLLRVPLTMLALIAIGIPAAFAVAAKARALAMAAAVLALVLTLPGAAKKFAAVPESILSPVPTARFESQVAPGYELLRAEARQFLSEHGPRASLCVLGDTALAFHTQARCGMAIGTWSAPGLNARQWRQLATELRTARPDLLYLAGSEAAMLRAHQPEVLEWIAREYRFLRPGMPRDAWFVRRDASLRR